MQRFQIPTEVCFGDGALDALREIRAEHAVLFTDAFLEKSGVAERIRQCLCGCREICTYSAIKPDPPIELIADALRFLLDARAEVVVALGGGSSIDAAKATVLIARKETGREIPLIAVPTTSGTGSEVTRFSVITDRENGVKYPLVSKSLLPEKAILESSLTVSVPPAITADTGFDVLTHALEAEISTAANDFSDAMAEKALELAFAYLPAAVRNGADTLAREKMHTASCMAGMAFDNVSLGVNHGIAHALGAHFHIPHGRANGMLLATVMAFNAGLDLPASAATPATDRVCAKLARIAARTGATSAGFGTGRSGAQALVRKLTALQKEVGLPMSLAEAGVTPEVFAAAKEHIVESALKDACTATNPRPVTAADVEAILRRIAGFRF
jgi:alcohol dehydrogenase class IV